MKRKLFTILVVAGLLATGPAVAQSYSHNYFFQMPVFHVGTSSQAMPMNFVDSFALTAGVQTVNVRSVSYNAKGKKSWTSYTTGYFDNQGRLTEMVKKHDSGRRQTIVESNHRVFDQRGNLIGARTYYYGATNFVELVYNDSNNATREVYYNKKHIRSSIERTYNEQNLVSTILYKNKKGRVGMSYAYYYYPDKKLKQVIKRNKKGKTSAIWDYSCDYSGRELKKFGDTSKYCTLKSYLPDGTIITTTQSLYANGDPWKTITQTDSSDRTVKHEYYRGKDLHLVYVEESKYSGKSLSVSKDAYYRKGKLYWSRTREYDAKEAITADIMIDYKHGKVSKIYKSEYLYNASGLLMHMKEYMNGRLKYVENFSYSFYR